MQKSSRSRQEDFEPVARLMDVPVGALVGVAKLDGERICLANVDGEIMAVSDICTHQEFSLCQGTLLPNATIECAWHGARFSLRSGKALRTPAEASLPVYQVRVINGAILVGGRRL
ncbi:MAG: Rieske (2Fe-2S) protein [Gemmatimonadaceae bacterium]